MKGWKKTEPKCKESCGWTRKKEREPIRPAMFPWQSGLASSMMAVIGYLIRLLMLLWCHFGQEPIENMLESSLTAVKTWLNPNVICVKICDWTGERAGTNQGVEHISYMLVKQGVIWSVCGMVIYSSFNISVVIIHWINRWIKTKYLSDISQVIDSIYRIHGDIATM